MSSPETPDRLIYIPEKPLAQLVGDDTHMVTYALENVDPQAIQKGIKPLVYMRTEDFAAEPDDSSNDFRLVQGVYDLYTKSGDKAFVIANTSILLASLAPDLKTKIAQWRTARQLTAMLERARQHPKPGLLFVDLAFSADTLQTV